MDVGIEVEGRVGRGSLAVCKELVSNSRGRRSVEPTWGQARGRAQGGGAGVLVAHMALAGMLDLFYLRVVTQIQSMYVFLHMEQMPLNTNSLFPLFYILINFVYFFGFGQVKTNQTTEDITLDSKEFVTAIFSLFIN